jgi:hypothetical protein
MRRAEFPSGNASEKICFTRNQLNWNKLDREGKREGDGERKKERGREGERESVTSTVM